MSDKKRNIIIIIIASVLAIAAGICIFMIIHTVNKIDNTVGTDITEEVTTEAAVTEEVTTTETATEEITTKEAATDAVTEGVIATVEQTEDSEFDEIYEQVTAKEAVNLRNNPSTANSEVVAVLYNGNVAVRTGVAASGWSRLEYNGIVCYAVTSYLTTDLSYVPETVADDGIDTVFTEINDSVTAKELVNLRSIPSVTNENSVVVASISNGEYVQRTGINEAVGWSRVLYNGQTLYCITSYLTN